MKGKLMNFFNDLLTLFIVFFLVFVLSKEVSAVTDQKSNVLKSSHKSFFLASAINPDKKKKTHKENSKSHHLQKEQASNSKGNPDQSAKTQNDKLPSYSFRPLLIQGKKRLIQKTKDMKVESGNIVESQLFFVDIDFKREFLNLRISTENEKFGFKR